MYERFTDRALKVMQLANQEAQRFNHEYVGTEHMLLGIVKEAQGSAAIYLSNAGIDLRKIRLEVEKRVQTGPDMVTMGKLPHTSRMKKAIEYAIEEARKNGNNYVGTEHILAGLLKEEEGIAGQILKSFDITYDSLVQSGFITKSSMHKSKLALLMLEKEDAIAQKDFVKASELSDQIEKLYRWGIPIYATKQENADPQSEEALHLITCVLLKYLCDEKGSTETLVEINKIIQECI